MKKYITKEEIDQKFAQRGKPNVHAKSGSLGYDERIAYYCDIDGREWTGELRTVLYKKYSCPSCAAKAVIEKNMSKYNLFEIRPDVAALLEDPNDAINCSEHCKFKKWFICPNCGQRLYKSVVNVSQFGLACNVCSDGFSYPNKFMLELLNQKEIGCVPEYSPEWISPKRYDFYFKYKDKDYIIEMDGGLGHGKKVFGNKYSVDLTIDNDKIKDIAAMQHNIQIIRIDCDKSNLDYLKDKIIHSLLGVIIDLSDVDWKKCDKIAHGSKLLDVCAYYNTYPFLSYKQLSEIFNVCEDVIRRYLRVGHKNGLCPKYVRSLGKQVICLTSQRIFASIAAAGKFYDLDNKSIYNCCVGKREHVHTLKFIYLNDYDGDILQLHPIDVTPHTTTNQKKVNMYDQNYNFVKSYNSIADAMRDNQTTYQRILRSIRSPHKFNFGKTFYYADDMKQPDKTKVVDQVVFLD